MRRVPSRSGRLSWVPLGPAVLVLSVLHFLAGCTSLSPGLGGVAAEDRTGWQYRVTLDPGAQEARVELSLPVAASDRHWQVGLLRGTTFVELEKPLLGDARLVHAMERESFAAKNPYQFVWKRPAGSRSSLTYRVPLLHRNQDVVAQSHSGTAWPYVESDHGMLTGATLFLAPQKLVDATVILDLPPGWPSWTAWERLGEQTYRASDAFELQSNLICAGAWREFEVHGEDYQAHLLLWPGQAAWGDSMGPKWQAVVRGARRVMQNGAPGQYLCVLSRPVVPGLGGSLVGRSIPMGVQEGLEQFAEKDVLGLLAHEFFHTWGIGRKPYGDDLRWLSEGGTEYMARWTLSQDPWVQGETGPAPLATPDVFADWVSDLFLRTETGERGLAWPLTEAGGDIFFEGGAAYSFVYDGGALVCAWLDAALRQHGPSHNLADFLRGFPAHTSGAAVPESDVPSGEQNLPEYADMDDFLAALQRYSSPEIARACRGWVTGNWRTAELRQAIAGLVGEPTASAETVPLDLRANLNGTEVLDLDPQAPVGRVGLATGDRLNRVNGVATQTEAEVRQAWAAPRDGILRVEFERAGEARTAELSLAPRTRYRFDPAPWFPPAR